MAAGAAAVLFSARSGYIFPQPPPQPQLEPQLQFPPQDIFRIPGSCNLKNFYPKRERKLETVFGALSLCISLVDLRQDPPTGPASASRQRGRNSLLLVNTFTNSHDVKRSTRKKAGRVSRLTVRVEFSRLPTCDNP
jgi:hypothetical protein